jgi:hypothetical protein
MSEKYGIVMEKGDGNVTKVSMNGLNDRQK